MTKMAIPLDHPLWLSLTGAHREFALGTGRARRYQPDVSILAALAPDAEPEAWADLRETCVAGEVVALFFFDAVVPVPPDGGWKVVFEATCDQMVGTDTVPSAGPAPELTALTSADVDEMLALVKLTQPGPFAPRTIELGRYLGVRVGRELVAMAGERAHVDGFREVSAVCTHPDHRGRGLADALVRAVVAEAAVRGETSFLHVATDNDSARRAYERIGFVRRCVANVVAVQALARD